MTRPAVLLISPGIIKWTDMDFGLPHLVSLGGYVEQQTGARVEILDLNYEGGDHETLRRTIAALEPLLCIGVSCYSSYDYLRVMALGHFLKRLYPGVPLITGGYHASALPSDLVFDGSPFDAVVVGEGEVPLAGIVQRLLGGERMEPGIHGPAMVDSLDDLPPYRFDLLARYWSRAHQIGRKLQIFLSRGCPYHCTFCMERAKTGYRWRAYSPERAVDELRRLARMTELDRWVVNVADPLFGFKRSWRREVLEGIVRHGLAPRQFWTLTRSDDLSEDDVRLLARARFSIGIGLESGSPEMLRIMQKTQDPERYLDAIRGLARLSRQHGLSFATNVIVGHPGETHETMRQTRDFVAEVFTAGGQTAGWVSIDPFRLYPGSLVHEDLAGYSQRFGTRIHHPEWWRSYYDAPFRAEHTDPSHEVDFTARVRFMHKEYPPIVRAVSERFRGQGRSIDRVFERSQAEQVRALGPAAMDALLSKAAGANAGPLAGREAPTLRMPIGLHVRDPWVRLREEAVRRLLERGVLRADRLIEALLTVAPERFLDETAARELLRGAAPRATREGEPNPTLPLSLLAMALEALEPLTSDRALCLGLSGGYAPALLAALVGPDGHVTVVTPASFLDSRRLARALASSRQVRVVRGDPTVAPSGEAGNEPFDRILVGGALPRFPASLRSALRDQDGRAVAFLGPRFRPADMVTLARRGDGMEERPIGRASVPVLAGKEGWLRRPAARAAT